MEKEVEDVAQSVECLSSMHLNTGFKVTESNMRPYVKERGGAVEGGGKVVAYEFMEALGQLSELQCCCICIYQFN